MFARVILPLLVVGLALYALLDLFGSEEDERGGLPRWLWAVIIVLLPIFGAVAWIIVKRSARRASGGGPGPSSRPGRRPSGPKRPSGPVAPDDDPEFLWRLEQEKRRREREGGGDTP
ncbi:PLD nuclease N-terminal domain-containing protein [Krasilnikoviella flava]|uniref:Phospholipase_D-nuclease N-terminal n=1 Tax=Krasilnikoviella flava TaxID=526729 RepID=A0A1T5J667_9MICO|nr:PLD nuclease N-terminal domain-containing protein [Krasilnikoviella flava]SKC46861.1 Phospholipase_D-nuclease N-terminal [Krasilnikoviella flava]